MLEYFTAKSEQTLRYRTQRTKDFKKEVPEFHEAWTDAEKAEIESSPWEVPFQISKPLYSCLSSAHQGEGRRILCFQLRLKAIKHMFLVYLTHGCH